MHGSESRDVETGMLFMVAGMLVLPAIDAIAKALSDTLPSGQVAWSRFLFQSVLLSPMALLAWRRQGPLVFEELHWHAARGALIAGATLFFFSAVAYLPLAEAIATFFVEPLLLTLLSAVLLGEAIGWRRVTACAIGFAGAMIIVRPSYEVFGPAALLPLGAALCFAFYLILTRRLAVAQDPYLLQFHAGLFGLITMSLALSIGISGNIAVLDPVWPSGGDWLLLATLGVIATGGHLLVVQGFKRASASILAPFQYLEIISATALGFLIFGDFPDAMTWFGIAIIISSGLYVFHRERKVSRPAAAAAPAQPSSRG